MVPHPIQLHAEPAPQMDRTQVIIRWVLLMALGTVGWSSLYWILYLGLPALAAMRISQVGQQQYLSSEGPRIVRVLRWLARAYAYLWLLTDTPPSDEPSGVVDLDVTTSGNPTAGSALLRIFTSLPALLLLAVASIVAAILWPIGAILILLRKRLPGFLFDFFLMMLRGQFRFVAFHLSLVDRYPSFEDSLALRPASRVGTV